MDILSLCDEYYEYYLWWATGKKAIERICGSEEHTLEMDITFAIFLRHAPSLAPLSRPLFDEHSLVDSPSSLANRVLRMEQVDRPNLPYRSTRDISHLSLNVEQCMKSVLFVNRVVAQCEVWKETVFSHDLHFGMLQRIWDLLLPDKPLRLMEGEERKSHDWSLLGFQGLDPVTDLRGMGMLSVFQLLYFAENYTEICRQLLRLSWDRESVSRSSSGEEVLDIEHTTYFPFAITGINITAFVNELLRDRTLDIPLYSFYHGNLMEEFNMDEEILMLYFEGNQQLHSDEERKRREEEEERKRKKMREEKDLITFDDEEEEEEGGGGGQGSNSKESEDDFTFLLAQNSIQNAPSKDALSMPGLSEDAKEKEMKKMVVFGTQRVLNTLYVDVFTEFVEEWERRNPQTVLEFPGIFADVKERMRSHFRKI